ncbi:IS110 family transposase [Pseudonocardia saturnea]
MVVLGIDAHKRSHTVVVVDDVGRKLGERTLGTTTADHLALLTWAEKFGSERLWAVEDCRHLSRRLERDLLDAAERIVRVPPKMMAQVRDSARSYGKSDPIDALAVARAALREPDLPAAHLDGPAREVQLLAGHRDDLVAERTRIINRLRWHLHELDPGWEPAARSLWRPKNLSAITERLAGLDGLVARLARTHVERCRELTSQIRELDRELEPLVTQLAPALVALCGCATSPRRRSSGRRPVSSGSAHGTPSPATTGLHRSRSGRATAVKSAGVVCDGWCVIFSTFVRRSAPGWCRWCSPPRRRRGCRARC